MASPGLYTLAGSFSFLGFLDLVDLFVSVVMRSEPLEEEPERPRARFILARKGIVKVASSEE